MEIPFGDHTTLLTNKTLNEEFNKEQLGHSQIYTPYLEYLHTLGLHMQYCRLR